MDYSRACTSLSEKVIAGTELMERIGDCGNFERKVSEKNILWMTVSRKNGWILQKDRLSAFARIVDSNGVQRGNGSFSAMTEKFNRLTFGEFLRPGDIIGVSRGIYEHYAVYADKDRVIHYAGESNDFGGNISIHEASMDEFLKGSKDMFFISFSGNYPNKIHAKTGFFVNDYLPCYKKTDEYHVFSPEKTLERAYSRLGEQRYSLIRNNCEHFAMWCKTGVSESFQVERIKQYMFSCGNTVLQDALLA